MISIIYRFKLDDQGLKCRNSYGTVREFPIHYLGLKTAKNKTRTLQHDFKTFSSRKFEGRVERGGKSGQRFKSSRMSWLLLFQMDQSTFFVISTMFVVFLTGLNYSNNNYNEINNKICKNIFDARWRCYILYPFYSF